MRAAHGSRVRSERGASAVEYAVLLGMIAAVLFLAVSFLGSSTSSNLKCAGYLYAGTTCVEGTRITTPTPGHTCSSQNGDNGIGCYGK